VQQAGEFHSHEVNRQLKCAGMLEAIRIRKCGFPVRRPYDVFTRMYKNLFIQNKIMTRTHNKGKSPKDMTREFVEILHKQKCVDKALKEIQIGTTKIFMKENIKTILDKLLEDSIENSTITIQKIYKRIRQRRLFLLTIVIFPPDET
jgi:myosin-5